MRIMLKNCEGESVKAGDGWTENETGTLFRVDAAGTWYLSL